MPKAAEATLAHQFEEIEQQREAAKLGMWIFLATELLFFGAMFFGYTVYRHTYPHGFAVAGTHMDLAIGTVNTGILLTSSFLVALAVYFSRLNARLSTTLCLLLTALLGLIFDALKFYEYHGHFKDGFFPGASWTYQGAEASSVKLLFTLYYIMTGVHALHVAIGIGLFLVMAVVTWRAHSLAEHLSTIENSALYWHFVDIVWIFLYPLFYFLGAKA